MGHDLPNAADGFSSCIDLRRQEVKTLHPKIFNSHEFQTLKVVTETILRDDEMPGARQAKANEFIDFQIKYDPELQERFHNGLRWLDQHSRRLHGKNFVALDPDQRKEIIQCLEMKAKHRPGEEPGREFFELAKTLHLHGLLRLRRSLKGSHPAAPNPKNAATSPSPSTKNNLRRISFRDD